MADEIDLKSGQSNDMAFARLRPNTLWRFQETMMGRKFTAAALVIMLASAVLGCSGGGGDDTQDGPDGVQANVQNSVVFGVYRGTASSVIEDETFSGQITGTRQFQTPVRIDIAPPAATGGLVEGNPFRLVITTDPQTRLPQEGQLSLKSSVLVPVNPSPVLLQFFEMAFNGTTLTGLLTDTHQAESAASANAVFSNSEIAPNLSLGVPSECPMRLGTVLQGTLDGNQVTVRVEGTIVCITGTPVPKRFVFEIRAARIFSRRIITNGTALMFVIDHTNIGVFCPTPQKGILQGLAVWPSCVDGAA